MLNYEKATKPTIYFIGVTTGSSSIMKVFPEWAQALVGRAMDAGILHGSGGGRLHLTDDNLVSLQMLANANIF